MQCSSAAGGNDIEIPSFCYSFAARIKRESIHVYAASAFGIPTLIPVIRLPCRSRARAGAIRGFLKRKSLSHSTPGKFEPSSQNSFQKAPISNAPVLERWRGDHRFIRYTGATLTQNPATAASATVVGVN